ncbi:TRAP transporter small permease [Kiloniella antarctica]|uniref:TRAP transporter small permease protein n=1 Tax=Kiloniella antarctica TaxID=1550907 RepID=A0ABW5BKQ9_9PROT
MKKLSQTLDKTYLVGAWLSGGFLLLLCGLILYSILARMLGLFAGGATDFAGYAMATSTFFALAYTFRSNGHIRILLLIQNTHGSLRLAIERATLGFMSFITCYLTYYTTRLAVDSWEYGERSEGADAILLWIPQVPVALGSAVFALSVIHTFTESIFSPEKINSEKLDLEVQNEI